MIEKDRTTISKEIKRISKHPKIPKVQLDTVIGKSSNKKVLLTMYLVDTHFMLIFT